MQTQCTVDIEMLGRLCRLTNRKSFAMTRTRNTCIFTAATLRDVLEAVGIPAELMRVEVVAFGKKGAISLGSDGDGSRRRAAGPGMWHGHLAVVSDGRFLLDPTLDQISGCKPFVGEITDDWLNGQRTLWWVDGERANGFPVAKADSATRYHAFPGRGGWKSAGDFRIGRRRDLVASILSAWRG